MKDSRLKTSLLKIWFRIQNKRTVKRLRRSDSFFIMSTVDTINYIKKHGCSISRYGDGEFQLMQQCGAPGFQSGSSEMSEALLNVLTNHSPDLLICMPGPMISSKHLRKSGKAFWEGWIPENYANIISMVKSRTGSQYHFGDSYISRPYSAYRSNQHTSTLFRQVRELWESQDILIIEGTHSRLGVGNDLFSNTKSIKRILAPAENAFSVYPQILDSVLSHWNGELVIMALGPTATVLASDLSKKGIQALDIGHIDEQYEWFKSGTPFQPIANKYVNEAIGGNTLVEYTDPIYESQIIDKIELP